METQAGKNVAISCIQGNENEIAHNFFEHIPTKNWKVVGTLSYCFEQNVPVKEAHVKIETALEDAMKSKKKLKKHGQAILYELNTLKGITQKGLVTTVVSSSSKVVDRINNFGNITQTNITQPKRKTGRF